MPQLNTEGMQMPIANKRAAQQVESGNQIALQQQMKAAGSKTPITSGDIQQLAGQQAAQDTATAQGAQAAENARTARTAQRDFQQQEMGRQEQQLVDQQALVSKRMDAENKLASMGRDIKAQLLDKELGLDERTGQLAFTNERQMADLAIRISQDENELKAKLQEMDQASRRRVAAAEYAASEYARAEEFASKNRQFAENEAMMREIRARKQRADEELRKARKKAGVTQKIIGAATMAAGAAIAYGAGWTGVGATTGASMAASGASQVAGAE